MAVKKLVHITTVPDSFIFLRGQIAFMKSQGFEIHAISSPGPLLDAFAEQEGVHVYPVEMPRRITPLQDLRALFQLQNLLQKIKPDIVHAHTPKGGLLGMLAATMAGTPQRIYHMHGLPLMTATKRRRRLLTLTEQISCGTAHQIICVSPSLKDVAIAKRLCSPNKITTLGLGSGNGVDAAKRFNPTRLAANTRTHLRTQLGIPHDALVIGFVGRIVHDKGISELTEAWKNIRQTHPQAHMLVVGPLEPQDPITKESEHILHTDPRIHLVGYIDEPVPYYHAMDLFVLPSYREGLSDVLLEAAAMELPVVATRIPGCTDAVVDGTTGTLVEPHSAPALETAIRHYLDNPDLRAQHGLAGRTRVLRDFVQSRIWSDLLSIYTKTAPAARHT